MGEQGTPVPATVVMVPSGATRRTRSAREVAGDVEAAVRTDREPPGADRRPRGRAPVAAEAGVLRAARSRERGDDGPERRAALALAVAAVEDLAGQVVGVVRAQRPAAQPCRARVPASDRAPPRPPERQLAARPRSVDAAARAVAESRGRSVDAAVGVADATDDRLRALERAPVGILAVPGKRGPQVRGRGEARGVTADRRPGPPARSAAGSAGSGRRSAGSPGCRPPCCPASGRSGSAARTACRPRPPPRRVSGSGSSMIEPGRLRVQSCCSSGSGSCSGDTASGRRADRPSSGPTA